MALENTVQSDATDTSSSNQQAASTSSTTTQEATRTQVLGAPTGMERVTYTKVIEDTRGVAKSVPVKEVIQYKGKTYDAPKGGGLPSELLQIMKADMRAKAPPRGAEGQQFSSEAEYQQYKQARHTSTAAEVKNTGTAGVQRVRTPVTEGGRTYFKTTYRVEGTDYATIAAAKASLPYYVVDGRKVYEAVGSQAGGVTREIRSSAVGTTQQQREAVAISGKEDWLSGIRYVKSEPLLTEADKATIALTARGYAEAAPQRALGGSGLYDPGILEATRTHGRSITAWKEKYGYQELGDVIDPAKLGEATASARRLEAERIKLVTSQDVLIEKGLIESPEESAQKAFKAFRKSRGSVVEPDTTAEKEYIKKVEELGQLQKEVAMHEAFSLPQLAKTVAEPIAVYGATGYGLANIPGGLYGVASGTLVGLSSVGGKIYARAKEQGADFLGIKIEAEPSGFEVEKIPETFKGETQTIRSFSLDKLIVDPLSLGVVDTRKPVEWKKQDLFGIDKATGMIQKAPTVDEKILEGTSFRPLQVVKQPGEIDYRLVSPAEVYLGKEATAQTAASLVAAGYTAAVPTVATALRQATSIPFAQTRGVGELVKGGGTKELEYIKSGRIRGISIKIPKQLRDSGLLPSQLKGVKEIPVPLGTKWIGTPSTKWVGARGQTLSELTVQGKIGSAQLQKFYADTAKTGFESPSMGALFAPKDVAGFQTVSGKGIIVDGRGVFVTRQVSTQATGLQAGAKPLQPVILSRQQAQLIGLTKKLEQGKKIFIQAKQIGVITPEKGESILLLRRAAFDISVKDLSKKGTSAGASLLQKTRTELLTPEAILKIEVQPALLKQTAKLMPPIPMVKTAQVGSLATLTGTIQISRTDSLTKQKQKPLVIEALKFKQAEAIDIRFKQATDTRSLQKKATKEIMQPRTLQDVISDTTTSSTTALKIDTIPKQALKPQQIKALKPAQLLRSKTVQLQSLRTPFTPTTPQKVQVPKVPTPGIPIPKLDGGFSFPKGGERFGSGFSKAYDTFVKRRGAFIKVGTGLPYKKALAKGARITKGTAARTFKVVQKGRTRQKDIPSMPSLGQFYQKGEKFIERTKYAIDSPGELTEITYAGISAKKLLGKGLPSRRDGKGKRISKSRSRKISIY